MDLTVLNTNLDAVSIVDTYESFIWTDRYYKYGDFELYAAMREGILDFIKQDYYLGSSDYLGTENSERKSSKCNKNIA